MIMEGCQGKPQISIMDKICPQCGHEIQRHPDLCSMVQIRKAVLWRHGI